jgi:hypothetical protein
MASFFGSLFGGESEREAADRNRQQYGLYNTTATGALDTGLNRSVGAVTDASNQAGNYLGNNMGLYGDLRTAGTGILDRGRADSLATLNPALQNYQGLQSKYGAGTDLYLNSLGVNGAAGNQAAVDAFQAGPGYEFTRDEGLNAINRRRAASGMLNSGNADADAIRFGTGLANQTYGGWQDRLGGLINPEMAAASGATGVSNNITNLIGADTAARLGLETGVTQGQAGTNTAQANNAVALGNSLGSLYTGDATNRVGVAGNVTSGNVSANNLQAQGEAQGARNGLGAALSLASIAAGGAGGGSFGSLFGGGAAAGGNGLGNGLANPQRNNTFGFNPLAGAFSFGG